MVMFVTVTLTGWFLEILFNFGSILGITIFGVDSSDAMNSPFLVGTNILISHCKLVGILDVLLQQGLTVLACGAFT